MISPTGQGIRFDLMGSGRYGSRRGNRKHKGVDYLCTPGQEIVAPISGVVVREAKPYVDSVYSGVVIAGEYMTIKMFYLELNRDLIGQIVKMGDVIGFAQDIAKKYGEKMLPHIHLEIEIIDPNIFIEMLN